MPNKHRQLPSPQFYPESLWLSRGLNTGLGHGLCKSQLQEHLLCQNQSRGKTQWEDIPEEDKHGLWPTVLWPEAQSNIILLESFRSMPYPFFQFGVETPLKRASQMALALKNQPANAGDKKHRFDRWVEKIDRRRAWQPIPAFLLGASHGQRSLAGYSPQGCKESHRTEMTQHAGGPAIKNAMVFPERICKLGYILQEPALFQFSLSLPISPPLPCFASAILDENLTLYE